MIKPKTVEIEYDSLYDDYTGAFVVRCGETSEECMTLDDALLQAKSMMITLVI